jgi:hypothetical protein
MWYFPKICIPICSQGVEMSKLDVANCDKFFSSDDQIFNMSHDLGTVTIFRFLGFGLGFELGKGLGLGLGLE